MDWDAIFFDCDGVILDSVDTKTKAFEKIFLPYGEDNKKRGVKYHLQNGGISRFDKFRYFFTKILGRKISNNEIESIGALFTQYALDGVLKAPYIEGAIETIKELHTLNIKTYVVSGTPDDELKIIFNKKNLAKFFNEIHGSPKTKNEIINDIINRNNYHCKRCLFVGDAMTDYNAAVNTGMSFIGIVKKNEISPFPKDTVVHSKISINNILTI